MKKIIPFLLTLLIAQIFASVNAQTGQKPELVTNVGHSGGISSAVFSPDGRLILSAGIDDNAAILWDASTAKEIRRFSGHLQRINSVAFSPDGAYILTGAGCDELFAFDESGEKDNTARLWDARTGREIRRFVGHQDVVNSVAFSPDGKFILTGSSDKTACLWETATGLEVRRFTGHTEMIQAVAFSPASDLIATGGGNTYNCEDCTTRLWDLRTGTEIKRFEIHKQAVSTVVFSPDGKSLFSGVGPLITEARIFSYEEEKPAIRRWNITDGTEIQTFEGYGAIAVSPDGQFLITAGAPEDITGAQIWNLKTGQKSGFIPGHNIPEHQGGEITGVAFSPDSKTALVISDTVSGGGSMGTTGGEISLRTFNIEDQRQLSNFGSNSYQILETGFSGRSNFLQIGDFLWNVETGGIQQLENYIDQSDLLYLKEGLGYLYYWSDSGFSPDGSLFFGEEKIKSGEQGEGQEATVRLSLWETETGELKQHLTESSDSGSNVTITEDNKFSLVENLDDLTIKFIDLETGEEIWKKKFGYDDHRISMVGYGRGNSFSKLIVDGSRVALIDKDLASEETQTFLKIIDAPTGKIIKQLNYDGENFLNSPFQGQHIVLSDSHSAFVRLYDVLSDTEALQIGLSPDIKTSWLITEDSLNSGWDYMLAGQIADNSFLQKILSTETVELAKEVNRLTTAEGNISLREEKSAILQNQLIKELNSFIRNNKDIDSRLFPAIGLDNKAQQIIANNPSGENLLRYNRLLIGRIYTDLDSAYRINASAFSGDGKYLVVSVTGDSVEPGNEIWEIETGKRISVLPGLGSKRRNYTTRVKTVSQLKFSKDSRFLLTHDPEAVKVWEVATGKLIATFRHEQAGISDASFSPEGDFLITGGFDNSARIWQTATGAEVCRLIVFNNRDWLIISPDGRFDTNNLEATVGASFVFPNSFKLYEPVMFARDYYEPGLLGRLLNGEQFLPIRDISRLNRVQPKVSIKEIKSASNDLVDVSVEVENITEDINTIDKNKKNRLSSGAFDLRLFRDAQLVGISSPKENLTEFIKNAPHLIEATRKSGTLFNTPEDKAWRKTYDIFKLESENIKRISPDKILYTFRNVKLPKDGRKNVKFTAYAFNEDKVKSKTTEPFKFEIPQSVSNAAKKGRAFIVSIGVNASENPAYDLRYAVNDARKMQEIIGERLKANSRQYSEVVQIPLVSDYGKDGKLSVNNAQKAIIKGVFSLLAGSENKIPESILEQIPNRENIKAVEPEDTLIITYAGHGYADRSGIFYLLPYDIGKNTFRLNAETLQKTISSDELSLWMQDITATEMIMIIDACHSSAAVQGVGFKPGPMGSRGLGQLAYDKDMKILSATQADNVALELNSLEQGLLSYALLQDGIVRSLADEDRDKQLLSTEWLEYAEKRVPELYREVQDGTRSILVDGKEAKDVKARAEIFKIDGEQKSSLNLQRPTVFDFKRRKTKKDALFLLP